jgi:hypothetical protein
MPKPDDEDDESGEYDAYHDYDPEEPETYPEGLYDDDGPPLVPCRNCGEGMFEDADRCLNCGTYQSSEDTDQKPRYGIVIMMILALIAALMMAVG